jgi:hypothetical protein
MLYITRIIIPFHELVRPKKAKENSIIEFNKISLTIQCSIKVFS